MDEPYGPWDHVPHEYEPGCCNGSLLCDVNKGTQAPCMKCGKNKAGNSNHE